MALAFALRDEKDVHVVVAQVQEGDGAEDPHGRQRRRLVPHSRVQHMRPERRGQRLRAAVTVRCLKRTEWHDKPRWQRVSDWARLLGWARVKPVGGGGGGGTLTRHRHDICAG